MESRNLHFRTADVARRSGYSVQQIRNLVRDGVLPPVARSGSGYRRYTDQHVRAALAYRALAAGVGPVEAKNVMRSPEHDMLELLDAAHARLHAERRDLALARAAVASIAAEPTADARPADAMSISELAGALGVRPSTLRHWETEGLITPTRSHARVTRTYTPDDVRDARIVHQLRLAGYRITQIRDVMPHLRSSPDWAGMLAARDASITTRSRSLMRAAAQLDELRDEPVSPPRSR